MESKKINVMRARITLGVIGFLILALIFGSDVRSSQGRKADELLYQQLDMFVDALEIVRKQYVEPVDDKKLIYGALKGMLISLDPYSAFLEPEVRNELQIETQGEFEGVGMEITLKDNIVTVVSPIEDTPAWRAGVKPGDRIIEIDGQSTKGFSTMEAARKLRGKKGTEVTISVMREGTPRLIKITLVRDTIKVKSVKPKVIQNVGYVRITEFQERTAEDLQKTLTDFQESKLEGLILDLRNNPGGLLSSAIQVSELFVPVGKLIVYTQGRDQKDRSVFHSRKKPTWEKPVVILVNGGSASASEIVLGALRDNLTDCRSV
ncbi:MAG: S41 family peptidase, partial [Candidatus Omnitrophica bacterium]|nr:S41 family peptidase [Candidatus Omnitrophota bacterium]